MEETYKIYDNVVIGENFSVEDFCIIGKPFGKEAQSPQTIIGNNATIRSHTVIYAGNKIGTGFSTGHQALIREENVIGNNVSIGSHSTVEHHVIIRDNVRLHTNVFVPEFSVLEKNCWLGPGVILTNARYPRSANVKEKLVGPHILEGAKLGAGTIVLPGITIGKNALIGAGTVVVKDVPDDAVVVGSPGRIIRTISEIQDYI